MKAWRIEPIPLYRFTSPGAEVLFQRAFGETIEMVIYAFLLHGDNATILVDTGLPADYAALNRSVIARKGPSAGFFPLGKGLIAELMARRCSPKHVVVTSLGPYAAGGLPQLPSDVQTFISARGAADLDRPEEAALTHPLSPDVRAALARARPIAAEGEILPGVTFIETGVHHPASAAVVIQTDNGRIVIADPVFTGRNLTEGLALGAAEHAACWHAMVRMLGGRADAILPIHDVRPEPIRREAWHPSLDPQQNT